MANLIDKAIGYFAPTVGYKRARARAISNMYERMAQRSYEGGGSGRRFANWPLRSATSANSVIGKDLRVLRERSRDLIRNNPYAARAAMTITSNTIGIGIVPQIVSTEDKNSQAKAKVLERFWNRFGETTYCDFDGRHDFYGLQALAMRGVFESGEVFLRRVYIKPKDPKRDASFKIQILESDFLDTYKNERLTDGGYIIQGIEFDKDGQRVAYWLYKEHPGGQVLNNGTTTNLSVRVEAKDILHVYRMDRPGQFRGVPWLAPVMLRLKDFDDYEDAHLMAKKIASCFGIVITNPELDPENENPDSEVGAVRSADIEMEPGFIAEVGSGQSVTTVTPPIVTDYAEFSRITLQAIATGLGISYESLTADLSNTSFSGGRLGKNESDRNFKFWRSQMVIPVICKGVWNWFEEAAALAQIDSNIDITWTEPRREFIDPVKETEAERIEVRMGKKSLKEVITESGRDPEKVFKQIAEERAMFKKMGLVFDSDATIDMKTVQPSKEENEEKNA